MRILIFHGYLLSGTGSNVYNARLADALVRLGHEVHLLCQDRHAERQPFVDATADWDDGALLVRALRDPIRCTAYRPNIGSLLPVYVADRYEGIESRTFLDCTDAEVAQYVAANVHAVREVAALVQPDVALANHLVMGPLILARALGDDVSFAVKIHGSALEYTVKASPERFVAPAREGLAAASGVLVGSWHSASSLWQAVGDPDVEDRTRLGPPGVDVASFRPLRDHAATLAAPAVADAGATALRVEGEDQASRSALSRELLGSLVSKLHARGSDGSAGPPASAFARDAGEAAHALERLDPANERLVAFVGKLIVNKGVDLLLAAWPLVLERVPDATLVVVGFGSYRAALERLAAALARSDLQSAREIAALGQALEEPAPGEEVGGPTAAAPLRYLLTFLDDIGGERREHYLAAAHSLGERVTFTGRLEHDELAMLLPACEAVVTPSTFPESFGMIAVEAAACGAFPISAAHSGLAEVSAVLARALDPTVAPWLSFALGGHAVPALARCVVEWLTADAELRARSARSLVATARERYSWEGVARGVLAAAQGELDALERPRAAGAFG
jgi:glycosyltransferase involved in cell wall biosynthesis